VRIAEISTLYSRVPPEGEGSVESLVFDITEGLAARGHRVVLYATADSRSSAELRSPVAASYTADAGKWDWRLYEAYQARKAFEDWRDFDAIHCHSYHYGLLYCDFVPVPSLHSVHIEPGPDYVFLAQRTRNRRLHFCSRYQARDFGGIDGIHVIPHGVRVDRYRSGKEVREGGYFAFLGRFVPDKGPLTAIRIAKAAGVRLKLAAPGNDYFREVIEPEIDGDLIEYVGEVVGVVKADFLCGAQGLLYPIEIGEPFGLVLIEAMAAGVPTLALNRGAVAEIVEHGVTGWIGETESDLVQGLGHISSFDRGRIRRRAEARFSSDAMVDRIEAVLESMVRDTKG